MKVSVTVCDKCGVVGLQADKYELKRNGERTTFDLCAEDAAPLAAFVGQFPKAKRLGRPAASSAASATVRQGRRPTVTTLEEIEASKAAKKTVARKAPAKKAVAKKTAAKKTAAKKIA